MLGINNNNNKRGTTVHCSTKKGEENCIYTNYLLPFSNPRTSIIIIIFNLIHYLIIK